jgi:hypothetical protein
MDAARVRGKRLGRPTTPAWFVTRIEELAGTTDMSIRQIQDALGPRQALEQKRTLSSGQDVTITETPRLELGPSRPRRRGPVDF